MTKNIKIKTLFNKRGNTYSQRNVDDCIKIVCKKLKINLNPEMDDNYIQNVMKYESIEKQVTEQFDCNKREIEFKINI